MLANREGEMTGAMLLGIKGGTTSMSNKATFMAHSPSYPLRRAGIPAHFGCGKVLVTGQRIWGNRYAPDAELTGQTLHHKLLSQAMIGWIGRSHVLGGQLPEAARAAKAPS